MEKDWQFAGSSREKEAFELRGVNVWGRGWPLYTYTGDTVPGTTSGQGMGGAWFLVSGTGNSIQQ
jgi:hypothetical protein